MVHWGVRYEVGRLVGLEMGGWDYPRVTLGLE